MSYLDSGYPVGIPDITPAEMVFLITHNLKDKICKKNCPSSLLTIWD